MYVCPTLCTVVLDLFFACRQKEDYKLTKKVSISIHQEFCRLFTWYVLLLLHNISNPQTYDRVE